MANSNKLWWVLASLSASTVFALIAPFAIYAEAEGLKPPYAVLFRYILIVAISTPFILLFARKHFKFTRQQFWVLMLQAVSTAVLNLSYMASFTFIPLSLAVIIFFTSPIITLMVVPFVFGGRLSPVKVGIFFTAFLGLILVVGPKINNLDPIGIILALTAAVTTVIQLLCMVKLVKEISPVAILYSVHVVAMFITFIIMGAFVYTGNIAPPVTFTSGMAWNFAGIVICYITGFGIFTVVARHLEPAIISFAANIEPIVTVSLAIWLFNESFSNIQAVGVAVVLCALVAGSLLKDRRAKND